MKKMMKDALVLFVITLTAGLVLGFVYQITKEPIAIQKEKAKMEAYKEVFTDAINFEKVEEIKVLEGFPAQIIEEVVNATNANGEIMGSVITVTSKEGYGGDITFTVGIRNDGTVNGISFLAITETPGLGMQAEDVLKPQFAGKKADEFSYTKTGATAENQIDSISGATITTSAITNGVNASVAYFKLITEGGNANE